MTDIPLPAPGDPDWIDWGDEQETLSDVVAAATDVDTPNTLVKRDTNASAKFNIVSTVAVTLLGQGNPDNATRKDYVDAGDAGRVPTSRQVASGTGLTGGGDLSADRTLAVAYGSSAGTAVQGNDTRVTADQAAGTASIRTLGTGATQAAAGTHAHTLSAATDTAAGIVELATDAEVQTGTDTARAVTPAGLAARTATETRAGVVELATTTEATTGTDTARAVTPAGVKAVADTKLGVVSGSGLTDAHKVTQAAYDALGAGRPSGRVYFIVG